MQIEMIKQPGGLLVPANDDEAERMQRFPSGGQFPIEIKLKRNYQFHKKVFGFFNFCFNYWERPGHEYQDKKAQFDHFRGKLLIAAGYYTEVYDLNGSVELKPQSLAYDSMGQEEFERVYKDLIGAALRTIFPGCTDTNIENQLLSFF